ncbi:energy-coupling factor transporter transmembrane component T family protein [Gardnerella vaginalis]|uniref:Cobalt transport protein n=1 Tax=Gardnerella vaginalis JCP8108 TaxID=1261066 RepID=S4GIG1_GARVA|nr:energy-coupling factor transporter transmembrane component T [Gardnerella vaginalis]EPI48959.1 cobalt transport protein [Gardnerella vaginalis JCP8108]
MQTKILTYNAGSTFLHKANPIAKLILAISVVVSAFIAQQFSVLVTIAVLILVAMAMAGILKTLFPLVRAMLILGVVMFFLQTIIAQGGNYMFLWFTSRGISVAARASLRLFCFALPLVSVLSITKLNDLANAVVQYLHVPYCYVFTITTAVRFVPIFAYEMSQITEAQMARGVEFDTKNPFKKIKLMMPLIVPLLVLSVRKADSCALAAEERGFYLRTRTSSYKKYTFGWRGLVLIVISAIMIALPIVVSVLAPQII